MKAGVMATRLSVLQRALPSRILVVDDDEQDRELIMRRLTAAGFEVEHAANGQEALEVLDRQWYPLVVTDWHMPVMDGLALTQTLRARGTEDTHIIMLTMRDASTDFEQGYVAGVDDYLTKTSFRSRIVRPHLRRVQHAGVASFAARGAGSGDGAVGEYRCRVRRVLARRIARPPAVRDPSRTALWPAVGAC